jgi:hypothetical protein
MTHEALDLKCLMNIWCDLIFFFPFSQQHSLWKPIIKASENVHRTTERSQRGERREEEGRERDRAGRSYNAFDSFSFSFASL